VIFDEGIFDESFIEDREGNGSYTLDLILDIVSAPVTHEVDLCIDTTKSASFLVGMSGYGLSRTFAVDLILALERSNPLFSETIINAIVWSYGQEVEALVDAISTMGLRLQLPYATTEDMDQYWSKILRLRRRYGELDSSFRDRLMTRLSIMKSSGTKSECEAVLNHILGQRDAVDLKTYWPGEVDVTWKTPTAMKLAESKYPELSEALDSMIAAGVSWSTRFPYKDFWVDSCLSGSHSHDLNADIGILGKKYTAVMARMELFDQGSMSMDADMCIDTLKWVTRTIDMRLVTRNRKQLLIDISNEIGMAINQLTDIIIRKRATKPQSIDVLCMKARRGYYRVDHISEKTRYKTLMLSMELT
jgi:hypothetical protein